MRTSVTSLSKKFISTFFAVTLAAGLIPAAAFADNGEETNNVIPSEEIQEESVADASASAAGEGSTEDNVTTGEDSNLSIPAATQRINQDMTLQTRTVAQAESTRSYFLAQTLESTRTVPIVSANLPLDTGAADMVAEDNAICGDEGGEDSDESDLTSVSIAAESVVVGSFEYRGITYAVEPGGESVASVAADHSKLPEEFIEAQTIVLPSAVTPGATNYYSVARIADYAFSTVKPSEDEEGIAAITIPASVTEIGDDAFTGFDTLQYVIVSEDNPNYSQYDGCLYNADQTSLLLIPEGRLGAVRIAPSVTEIDPEVFSHCPSVDTLVADADSAAYQLLLESDGIAMHALVPIAKDAIVQDGIGSLYDIDYNSLVSTMVQASSEDVGSDASAYELSLESRESNFAFALSGSGYSAGTINTYNHSRTAYEWKNYGRYADGSYGQGSSGGSYHTHNNVGTSFSVHYGWQMQALRYDSRYGVVNRHGGSSSNASAWADGIYDGAYLTYSLVDGWYYKDSSGNDQRGRIVRFQSTDHPFEDYIDEWVSLMNASTESYELIYGFAVNWDTGDPNVKVSGLTGNLQWSAAPETNGYYCTEIPTLVADEGFIFVGWYDDEGQYVCGGTGDPRTGVIVDQFGPLDRDITLHAKFVSSEKDVAFDPNDGAAYSDDELPRVWVKHGAAMPTRLKAADAPAYEPDGKPYNEAAEPPETYEEHANLGPAIARSNLYVPYARLGYEFNGYWSTKYSEDPAHPETIGGSSITPRQYYDANMNTKTATNPEALWLEESPDATRLYAHWKYKIALDPNLYGRSGAASAAETADVSFDTSGYTAVRRDPEDEASAIDHYVDAFGNEFRATSGGMEVLAIDQAPVTLPAVVGRVGYLDEPTDYASDVDTRGWGVKGGAYGAATGLLLHDGSGVTVSGTDASDPGAATLSWGNIDATTLDGLAYFTNKTQVPYAKPTSGAPGTVNLYLDWSSRAKRYTVTLTSDYAFGEGDMAVTFAHTNGDATASITAQYDTPLLMKKDGRTVNCTDQTLALVAPAMMKDGQHEHVFQGFYTQRNGLDTTNGEQYIASEVEGSGEELVSTMAPTSRLWLIDSDSELFALWGRAVSTVTLDLQGGRLSGFGSQQTIAVMDGAAAFELAVNMPVAELPGAYRGVPTRAGYTFKGYYTKSASLAADAKTAAFATHAETADTTGYYLNQGGTVAAAKEDGEALEWKFRTNTVLYAHWTYTLDLKVDAATDKTTSIALKSGFAGSGSADAYGNVHPASASVSNGTYTITALSDVPVLLPFAQGRTGYRDTCAWAPKSGSVLGDPQAVLSEASSYTVDADGALAAPAACSSLADPSKKVTLYASWEGQARTYWVRLVSSYADATSNAEGDTAYAAFADEAGSAASEQLIRVTYDGSVLTMEDGKGYVTVVGSDGAEKLAPVAVPHHARATLVGADGATVYDNLDFKGFYAAKYGCVGDNVPSASTRPYVSATGTLAGCETTFPLVSELAEKDPASAIVLYARWAQPTRDVVFNYYDATTPGASLASDDASLAASQTFSLQKGDVIADQAIGSQLASIASTLRTLQSGSAARANYEFAGFWTHPYKEDASSMCYFVLDGSTLRPVSASARWEEDTARPLYAHWKYRLRFDVNATGTSDVLSIDETAASWASAANGNDTQTVAYGEITYGQPVTDLVFAASSIERLRSDGASGFARAGYDFAGWYTAQDKDSGTRVSATTDFATVPDALAPQAKGLCTLYAAWTPHTYKVNLIGAYGDYRPDGFYDTVVEDVVFDEPFLAAGQSVTAPHIAGYRFMGYFTHENGAGEAYTESTTNANKGQVGGVRVAGAPKTFTVAGLSNGDTVDLYASYERLEYTVLFNTDAVQPANASKVESVVSALSEEPFSSSDMASYKGRLEANRYQATDVSDAFAGTTLTLHYGDALAGEHALPVPALKDGRTDTFWCQGYTFAGWYSFPSAADGSLNVVYAQDGMVDLKASGAVRFKAASYGAGHEAAGELSSFDVEIADVENPTMTLYAVWERNAYCITWDETSSLVEQGVSAPAQVSYQIALYGSGIERTSPVFRDHVFAGTWHASAACSGSPVTLSPFRPSVSSSLNPVYFAKWDGTEEHAVLFYPGDHGSFSGTDHLQADYLFADATSVGFSYYASQLQRNPGYTFVGWREAENAEDAASGIVADDHSTLITSLSGVAGFSSRHDDIYLVAQYSPKTYVILLDVNGGEAVDPASISFKEADAGPIVLPGATDMKLAGSTFAGWERDGVLLSSDVASGITVGADGSAEIDPHLFVVSMKDPSVLEIPLRAKWKANTYVVRFNLWKDGSGSAGSDTAVSDVLEVPVAFGGTLTMPYPAAAAGSKRVFSHWGASSSTTKPDTLHAAWVPEASVTFDAAFLSALKSASKAEPVYDAEHDRYVLDLYAEFGRAISATLPTTASIHVDPHNPGAMIVTDTVITSDVTDEYERAVPVQVVSLSYSSIDANGSQPGTTAAFDGAGDATASKVKLAVYAKAEDASFRGFADELRDVEFVKASIVPNSRVRFSLGDSSDVRTLTDLQAGGFAPFAKGRALHIVYSLAFEEGYDESAFVDSLPDANVVGADGKSRAKYDIARVCYTIGYAPQTAN